MTRCVFFFIVALSAAAISISVPVVASPVAANHDDGSDTHPIVPGFERFADVEEITEIERGRLLINELNCVACHRSAEPKSTAWSVPPKQAPVLTEIGKRVLPQYFAEFLLDPHAVKPGTMMPDVLAGKSADEKKHIAESIGHFLASTGRPTKQSAVAKQINLGKKLYHTIGCVACHDPRNTNTKIATSIPLGDLSKKYRLPGLTKFLDDPKHNRPAGRMPQFNWQEGESQLVAAYLLGESVISSTVNYEYYEGEWDKLPDFKKLEPVSTGTSGTFDINIGRPDSFAVVFTGYWEVAESGEYIFSTISDDGSRLFVDGEEVVDNDGVHSWRKMKGKKQLEPGVHEIRVEYFEGSGDAVLKVEVLRAGEEKADLDSLLRSTREEVESNETKFVLDQAKADEGKLFFQSVGCANCHEFVAEGVPLVSTLPQQTEIEKLTADGCLAAHPVSTTRTEPRSPEFSDPSSTSSSAPSSSAPWFGLTERQRDAIAAAIKSYAKNNKPPPGSETDLASSVHQKLLTLNCYACHSRESDGIILGGVIDKTGESLEVFGRKKWFTSTEAEMGDEGAHPPYLKSVGAKFKPQWLKHVLQNGADDRPYMLTRMPKFNNETVTQLADELIELDRLESPIDIEQTEDLQTIKKHGRYFTGAESLACIKCHTYNNFPATGIQAIDLTTMTKRLDKTWFHAYMKKPSRFRRGTRMPESWPGGKSFYPDILAGDVDKQIDAIWNYLADGAEAKKPKGLIKSKMELIATDAPVIYRNFIEGAGPRAIAVGYPGFVNLAFDAQNCRMALIWQENFIDASRHWSGRGQGFEPPLGENILKFPDSPAFALAEDAQTQWPTDAKSIGTKFLGYSFDTGRRPTFRYQVADVEILDHPIPNVVEDRPLLNRKFSISSGSPRTVWYRLAQSANIEEKTDDSFLIDDRLTVKLIGAVTPTIRSVDGKNELILEIKSQTEPIEFEIQYDW